VTVTITGAPPTTIGIGANWQYAATVSGSTNQNVSWTATSGTIDPHTGLYIAPNSVPSPAAVTITAAAQSSPSSTASATVTVQANDPLGTVTNYTQFPSPNSCPSGGLPNGTCFQLAVSCPGVSDFSVYLKVYTPTAAPIGTVLFGVGTGELLGLMGSAGSDVVGVDWRVPLDDARRRVGAGHALQGNLDPALCLAPWPVVADASRAVLAAASDGSGTGHIFNLGHGVLPESDPGILAAVVELVHAETALA